MQTGTAEGQATLIAAGLGYQDDFPGQTARGALAEAIALLPDPQSPPGPLVVRVPDDENEPDGPLHVELHFYAEGRLYSVTARYVDLARASADISVALLDDVTVSREQAAATATRPPGPPGSPQPDPSHYPTRWVFVATGREVLELRGKVVAADAFDEPERFA